MSKKAVSVGVIKAEESECSENSMIIAGSVCKFFTHSDDDSEYSAACCRYLKCKDLVRVKVNDGYELVFASSADKELEQDENGEFVVDEADLNMVAMFILKQYSMKDESAYDGSTPAIFSDVIVMRKNHDGAYVDVCMDDFVSRVSGLYNSAVSLEKLATDKSGRDKSDDASSYRGNGLPKFSEN
jgi:hypothetical protein